MTYAIVAIPTEDDYVWKISSEKVPHLTLLFLGDQLNNVGRVTDFIDHMVRTSMSKTNLFVDRRGKLGDKDADVLFFNKLDIDVFEDARNYLLTNTDIQRAYNSVEQFPKWIPHLTLGYPESPAHPDKRDYPGTHWVTFDRLALWTDDYEGVEFPLKNESADTLSMLDKGAQFLEHYGVLGMKWGVRRTAKELSGAVKKAYKPSEDAVRAQEYMSRAKLGGVLNLDNREMQRVITRMRLEREYKELYGERQWHNAGVKWLKDFVTDVGKDAASSWVKRPGSNFTGRTSSRVRAWNTGQQFMNTIEGSVVERRALGR